MSTEFELTESTAINQPIEPSIVGQLVEESIRQHDCILPIVGLVSVERLGFMHALTVFDFM